MQPNTGYHKSHENSLHVIVSGANEPNLISVKPLGETQIKVTWQSLTHVDSDKQYLYKLYIDDHLEYFGKDVMYIVRRLTPDSIYHFKLRWCVRVKHKHHCSPFSKTLSGTTAQSSKFSLFMSVTFTQ